MDEQVISKYDRLRGTLNALFTKPSTVKNVESITGRSETFVIETARTEESGDYIFLERTDENGVTRLAIPPRVADAIARQRESLTTRRRSITGKRLAAERKELGIEPGFLRKKKQ